MNNLAQFKSKLITIALLVVAIAIGLFILNFKGCNTISPEPAPTPTPEVTPEPSFEPVEEPVVEEQPEVEPEPSVDLESEDSLTRYVSQTHLLSESYVPADLRKVNVHTASDQQLREEAAVKLEEMFKAAIDDRIYLKLVSGYRSYQEQADLFSYYTQTRGAYYASVVDDHPGASEHQLGLGADIGCWNGACELSYCFTQYADYTWLQENSWKYGWIERYPEGKQSVTSIVYSPWHYRYVGVDEAAKIYESGLTMEEYYGITD
ncbi:MAG: M15 family metallopeptidase [Solobacterium sp.]|nr:M15 family metallopeptidase [Solobacterium sp.]